MDFKKLLENYKEDLIKDTQEFLRIPSVIDEDLDNKEAPFGKEIRRALDYILDKAKKDGFITKNVDNTCCHIEYGEGEEIVGILTHLDVVPAGDGWDYDPFGAEIVDNIMYARGTIDDKGPTMSSYYVLKMLKDNNIKVNKKIRLIIGCDEETGWRGIDNYAKKEKMPDIGFSPDANFPLIYGEKAVMNYDLNMNYKSDVLLYIDSGDKYNVVPDKATITLKGLNLKDKFIKYCKENKIEHEYSIDGDNEILTTRGKGAHAMQPDEGINALDKLISFVSKHYNDDLIKFYSNYLLEDTRGKKLNISATSKEMGPLTNNIAFIKQSEGVIKIGMNMRIPDGVDMDNMHKDLKSLLSKSNVELVVLGGHEEVHFVPKDGFLVKTLMESYRKYTNDTKSEPYTIGGGTYSRCIKNCCAFGPLFPGRKDVVHQANEHISIDDLLLSTLIYADSIYNLAK